MRLYHAGWGYAPAMHGDCFDMQDAHGRRSGCVYEMIVIADILPVITYSYSNPSPPAWQAI